MSKKTDERLVIYLPRGAFNVVAEIASQGILGETVEEVCRYLLMNDLQNRQMAANRAGRNAAP